MKKKEFDGYLTVYVALMLGIILSLIITMLYGIRIQTIRFETECVADMAIESIFGEFHREMNKQYGLLFIDSSYGADNPSDEYTASHLLYYMNRNFDNNGQAPFYVDLTDIHADNVELSNIAYASDSNGKVLRHQIKNYIYNEVDSLKCGYAGAESLQEKLAGYTDYDSRRNSENERIDGIMDEVNSKLSEDEDPYSISNPADSVESLTPSGVLYYALGDKSIDSVSINTGQYISNRSHNEGIGLPEGVGDLNVADRLLFDEYILKNCGYYKMPKDGSHLNYEVEYILKGQNSDMNNLKEVAEDIFKTRYVINMEYLLNNGAKQAEAMVVATAATSALMIPELVEAVKYSILFAWGYAESAKDMRILYDGHKLPLVKSDISWNTPLTQMVDFKAHLGEYSIPTGDLGYREYLTSFLLVSNLDRTTMHLMDIMEMDIRDTPGNAAFRMDGMIYCLSALMNVSSGYGYGCNIKRFYAYE